MLEKIGNINMDKSLKIIIGFCIIILILNFIKIPTVGKSYSYQTVDNEFAYRCVPSKGNQEVDMIRAFEKFKADNPEFQDLILYRTFKKRMVEVLELARLFVC